MRKIVEIFNRIDEQEGRKALTSFYVVGVLGYALPFSRAFFIEIIPLALLFNGLMLFGFHRPYNWKHISIFSVVFLLGWGIEVLGVKTGVVFGDYSYGPALGLKVSDVPLLIGVNWLMLVYASLSIACYFIKSTVLSALFASFIMAGGGEDEYVGMGARRDSSTKFCCMVFHCICFLLIVWGI